MRLTAAIAIIVGLAPVAVPSADASPPEGRRACARLVRSIDPRARVAAWRGASERERRERLISALRIEAMERSRRAMRVLRAAGARDLRLLWGPGAICGVAPESAWQVVSDLPGVEAVFDDPPRLASEIDDDASGPNEAVPPQPPLVSLRVPEVWERGITGSGVLVALIDTGVDMDHPDLAAQVWVNAAEVPGNGVDDDENGYVDDVRGWDFAADDNDPSDSSGHGTRAAGLLAGNGASGEQTGVAPGVTLMVLRRGTTESALWEASQYAVENGARIISQSTSWKWSFVPPPDYASWRRQTDVELAAGVIHANSSGNNGTKLDTDPVPYNVAAPANGPPPWHHPEQDPAAGVSSVLGVGNVDARTLEIAVTSPHGPAEWTDISTHRDPDYPFPMPAEYRDYPTWDGSPGLGKPDLVAPGENSLTTELGGGYTTFGGTSASTPRVAGILALMLEAVPTSKPADLAEALLTTCRDAGPAGRDSRFGAGIPDALDAVEALGPTVRVSTVEVIDPGPPRGDGDEAADAGEIDRLRIELENTSSEPLSGVELVLTARENAIVRDGWDLLASIPAGGRASTSDPHFGVELPQGSCGRLAELGLEIRVGDQRRVETLFVGIGTETQTPILSADFETPSGFVVSGDATSGGWVREAPIATEIDGKPANPGDDHTPDGSLAWVTGNGPSDPEAADVDGGATRLLSPASDAAGYDEVTLDYHRWFFSNDPLGVDRLLVEASADGSSWTLVEEVTATENRWRTRRLILSDLMTPSTETRLRFTAEDGGSDEVVEAGLDDLDLLGTELACTPWSLPPGSPDPVGSSLRLRPVGVTSLELVWDPPSAMGGENPVSGYSVTSSDEPDVGFAEIGRPSEPRFVEVDGFAGRPAEVRYYLVDSIP